jgi:hypothetical protein
MTGELIADYRRRGWSLVPIPAGEKGPRTAGWQDRNFEPDDFPPGGNVGLILGPRSGEVVDVDLDCSEALALADLYLIGTGAVFGRTSKARSHRLYIAPGAIKESFADPSTGDTLLELRAAGRDGGAHQTVIPPSVHPSGEAVAWDGDAIAPVVIDAARLRRRCAGLAIGCLVRRYVSETASKRPGPDLPRLLWEFDYNLGADLLAGLSRLFSFISASCANLRGPPDWRCHEKGGRVPAICPLVLPFVPRSFGRECDSPATGVQICNSQAERSLRED